MLWAVVESELCVPGDRLELKGRRIPYFIVPCGVKKGHLR